MVNSRIFKFNISPSTNIEITYTFKPRDLVILKSGGPKKIIARVVNTRIIDMVLNKMGFNYECHWIYINPAEPRNAVFYDAQILKIN